MEWMTSDIPFGRSVIQLQSNSTLVKLISYSRCTAVLGVFQNQSSTLNKERRLPREVESALGGSCRREQIRAYSTFARTGN